jgi:hypothetical protein
MEEQVIRWYDWLAVIAACAVYGMVIRWVVRKVRRILFG